MKHPLTLALLILLLSGCITAAMANTTQTNTSGSNTAISGGYTSSASTTYQSGSSSNTLQPTILHLI